MKTIKLLALSLVLVGFSSCSSDDDNNSQQQLNIEYQTINDLYAPVIGGQGQPESGDYVRFSFSTGSTVTDDSWDIAFRGTTILVNGGEATADDQPSRTGNGGAYSEIETTFNEVTSVDSSLFNQDTTSGGLAIQGWYDYDSTTHIISPKGGVIYAVRTHDGKYAKVEILSYYQDSQPNAQADNYQYYTFKYAYQPNDGVTSFE